MIPKVNIIRIADRRLGVIWNDYDYRSRGGKRYRIGAALLIGNLAIGVRWSKPGTDFGKG